LIDTPQVKQKRRFGGDSATDVGKGLERKITWNLVAVKGN